MLCCKDGGAGGAEGTGEGSGTESIDSDEGDDILHLSTLYESILDKVLDDPGEGEGGTRCSKESVWGPLMPASAPQYPH